ncbi:ATP-binding protein [Streptomyces sp. NPDC042319]|uniref:ATP-binding protein n=1 Tax=Streptomyces sp. NPDC042319 TaxID=3154332 RepID=UPI0033CE0E99
MASKPGVLLWIDKAPAALLSDLARCGALMAAMQLRHMGFEADMVRDPTPAELGDMLRDLPVSMAGLALHGLAIESGSFSAGEIAVNHWDELWSAAMVPAPEPVEDERLLEHHSTESFAEDAGDGAANDLAERLPDGAEAHAPLALIEEAEQAAQELRSRGAELAERLSVFAVAVREGRVPHDSTFDEEAVSWLRGRARLAELAGRLTAESAGWNVGETYDVLDRLIAGAREAEERRKQEGEARLSRVAELRAAYDRYVGLLEAEPLEVAREGLRTTLATLEKSIREMGSTVPRKPAECPAAEPEAQREEGQDGTDSDASLSVADTTAEGTTVPEPDLQDEPGAPEAAHEQGGTNERIPASIGRLDGTTAKDCSEAPAGEEPERVALPDGAGEGLACAASVWAGDEGEPSVVEKLIGQVRFAEAWWMSKAAAEPARRTQALSFAHAAFHLPDAQAAFELQLKAAEQTFPTSSEDREAHLVALVAALRSGLSAGWAPALVTEFAPLPGLPRIWSDLLHKLVTEVRQGLTITPGEVLRASASEPAVHRSEIAERARQLQEDLPMRTIALQRGTKVLQTLSARDGELGRTLSLVVDWAEGRAESDALDRHMERFYRRADAADRLIDATDRATRSPKQAKESIHSTAREQLRNHVKSVVDLLHEAQQVAALPQYGRGREVGTELVQAVTAARRAKAPAGPGGAALQVLLRWLNGEAQPAPRENGLTPSTDCLLALPALTWQNQGGRTEPFLNGQETLTAMLGLLQPPEVDTALTAHLERGDVHLARRLLEAVEKGELYGTEPFEESALVQWRQKVDDSAAVWKEHLAVEIRHAETLFAHIRVQNLLSPELESQLSGRLMDLGRDDFGNQYGKRRAAAREVIAELRSLVERKTEELRGQLSELTLEEQPRQRIAALLDEDDVVTAEELLSFARQGRRLPEREAETGEELKEFLAGVRHSEAPAAGGTGVSAGWWARHYAAGRPLVETTEAALQSWEALADPRSRSNAFQKHVGSVLRLLGLTVNQVATDEMSRKDWSVLRLSVRAEVSESVPGYVAILGSQAHNTYKVLVISDEQRGEGPLRHLPESAQGAHIILYLQPLGTEGRRRLAQWSRNRPQQAIVVDPAVVGWIAAREPRSFRAVQRITLPWAGYVPYAPYLAGRVPPEVFKGRDTEKSAIMGRDGSLFLYGGRQLGKSSLLRQVVDTFQRDNREDHIAVYIDLRTADIGYAEPPERIWGVLAAELKRRGVIASKLSERADAETIASNIRQWIEHKPSRRVLILADEADAFLNADARPVYTEGGQSTFRTVMRLQQLMQDTNRGFKVVFAGLHQVQRFNRLTNVITAHGGPGILVGPLLPKSAVELVVDPLAAVGLFFAAPDLVWRILALTNYQANLLQIFCEGLVVEMQERTLSADGSRPLITEADVQKVAASQEIRHQIKDRLRLTIDLEDRYRVLTLILALRSLRDGYARGYTPQELLEEARTVWPEGFPPQYRVHEVGIDLVEMEGLGLVIQLQGGRVFAMRSPNVVNMLGTREELDAELRTTEFSQPYDYNPRAARRSLGADRSQVTRMSPLTEDQWHEALSAGTAVIAASAAMGAGLIDRAAQLHVGNSRKILPYGPADDLAKGITEHTRLRAPHLLLVDLRGEPISRIQQAVDRLTAYTGALRQERPASEAEGSEVPRRRAVVVTDPLPVSALEGKGATLIRPQRWNATSVRAWPESPFFSPEERRNLIDATGGWPGLVERVMFAVRVGTTRDAALDRIREHVEGSAAAADHLQRSGLGEQTVQQLGSWAEMFTVEEHRDGKATATPQDLAFVLETSIDAAETLLAGLDDVGVLDERPSGVTVDPVTFRALKTLQEPAGGAE